MKGKYRIVVQNKRIRYDIEIKRNITIIRGDSATGKTVLVEMIREFQENGAASGVELGSCRYPEEFEPDLRDEKIQNKNTSN